MSEIRLADKDSEEYKRAVEFIREEAARAEQRQHDYVSRIAELERERNEAAMNTQAPEGKGKPQGKSKAAPASTAEEDDKVPLWISKT